MGVGTVRSDESMGAGGALNTREPWPGDLATAQKERVAGKPGQRCCTVGARLLLEAQRVMEGES